MKFFPLICHLLQVILTNFYEFLLAYCLLQALRFGIEMKKEQEKKLPNQSQLWPLPQEVPLLTVKENLGSQGKLSQICSNEMKYVNETYQRFMTYFGVSTYL